MPWPSIRCASRGSPSPHWLSHLTSRPGSAAFHSVKSRGVALQRVGLGADAFQQVCAGVAGQLAVVREAGNVEVDIAAALVGVALFQQPADDGQHLRYMLAGPREDMGLHDVQAGFVAVETPGIQLRDFLDRLALGQGGQNHLVAAGFHQFPASCGPRR